MSLHHPKLDLSLFFFLWWIGLYLFVKLVNGLYVDLSTEWFCERSLFNYLYVMEMLVIMNIGVGKKLFVPRIP